MILSKWNSSVPTSDFVGPMIRSITVSICNTFILSMWLEQRRALTVLSFWGAVLLYKLSVFMNLSLYFCYWVEKLSPIRHFSCQFRVFCIFRETLIPFCKTIWSNNILASNFVNSWIDPKSEMELLSTLKLKKIENWRCGSIFSKIHFNHQSFWNLIVFFIECAGWLVRSK